MTKLTFAEQQKIVEEKKAQTTERKTNDYIQKVIDKLADEPSHGDDRIRFRPLVQIPYVDGKEIEKHELLSIMKNSTFPNKKLVVNEIRKNRVKAVLKNGGISLIHAGK